MDNNNVQQPVGQQPVGQQPEQPGKGQATASMILGIVTLVCIFFGYGALLGIITGIIGLILGIKSKNKRHQEWQLLVSLCQLSDLGYAC